MTTVSSKEFFGGGSATVVQPANTAALNIPSQEERKSLWQNVVSAAQTRNASVKQVQQSDQGLGSKVLQTVGHSAGFVGDALFEGIKAVTPEPVEEFVGAGMEKVAQTQPVQSTVQAYEQWKAAHPEAAGNLEAAVNIGSLIPVGKGASMAGKKVAQTAVQTAKGTTKALGESAAEFGIRPSEMIGKTKNYLSRQNVGENFDTSIDRLSSKGDPLAQYDEFFDQERKFKSDIKQDTAIGVVGSRIGDNFEKVVKQRQDVGKTLGAEVEKIGGRKTDITTSFGALEKELYDQGLSYDGGARKLIPSKTSKVSSQDRDLLEEYVRDFNKLGSNPTVAELDAFLSRTPRELDVFKNKNNVTKTTNGERIVKAHLRTLREEVSAKKDPVFEGYDSAKKDYEALSNFLDEGITFLGRKTSSGDYARDASISKSAVQSVLNSGKKDWLLKLEDLTEYPALDESVLALQAMKDAGNFRGKSLLEILNQGSDIPSSAKGFLMKGIEKGVDFAADRFVGTEAEQTRRVIMERLRKGQETTPSDFKQQLPPVGLSTRDIARVDVKKIKQEDFGDMRDFVDYVGGDYKPDAKMAKDLELAASRMWEHYLPDVPMPKTTKGMASFFSQLLDRAGWDKKITTKGQPRDDKGRFTTDD